jgi:hypothetical protein
LLEELYRTMILVAGRLPLWLILPSGAPEPEYLRLAETMAPLEWEGTPPFYVNMGFPRRPQPQEYLAAAMWLTCKSEADPFKGILKIIPILEAVETGFTAPLLCDVVKEEIIRGAAPGGTADPYLITVERVISYAASSLAPEQTDLIRDAAVLKILGLSGRRGANGANGVNGPDGAGGTNGTGGVSGSNGPNGVDGAAGEAPGGSSLSGSSLSSTSSASSSSFTSHPPTSGIPLASDPLLRDGPSGADIPLWPDASGPWPGPLQGLLPGAAAPDPSKAPVLERWMEEWGWGPERLARLLSYDSWSERERLMQGNDLLILLFSVYVRISSRLMELFPDQVDAQDEELTPFAARIMGRQRGLESTVDLLPSQFHRDGLSRDLALHRDPDLGLWSVYAIEGGGPPPEADSLRSEGDLVFQAPRAVRAAAWLVRNGLSEEGFRVTVDPGTDSIDPEHFHGLLERISETFPPVSFRELDPESIWLVGAQGPVFLTFNFETPEESSRLVTMDAVFRTGWGELRHEWLDVGEYPSEADKCLTLASLLSTSCGVANPANLVDGTARPSRQLKRAFSNVKAALASSIARTQDLSGAVRSLIDL